ncbi:MYND-type domain-containing protein [Mycena indigotica]|uniref:MYND-type domain-containing protein n=1 Tax=Mycena indigotica TaxID=2126181 RepID=A0A8H6S5G9_9AGAR|nr:MYND-type domain-containing protein [Mycena indigotica]KAF7292590.1 MYND-type domain-containing protein [Mycena indigotica]
MSTPNSTGKQSIIGLHAVHPDNAKSFKSFAPSRTEVRSTRNAIHTACTRCLKTDEDPEIILRRCGKCKGVWYCSKQCQTAHWPTHKKTCHLVEGPGIQKLVQNFCANSVLNKHLQACLALAFDLHIKSRLDSPFIARVDIGIEPADIMDFFNVFLGRDGESDTPIASPNPSKPPVASKRGMLQITAFQPSTICKLEELTEMRQEIWKKARESADQAGCEGDSVGLVEFASGGERHDVDMSFPHPQVDDQSAITSEVTEVPFSIATCIEFMNMHIRADKKNQYMLRTEIQESDLKTIRNAALHASDDEPRPVQLLRVKMEKEDIYNPFVMQEGEGIARKLHDALATEQRERIFGVGTDMDLPD